MMEGDPKALRAIRVLESERQYIWSWPAVANFVLVGAGTGLYVVSVLASTLRRDLSESLSYWWLELLALTLAVLGFLALTIEAGHPARGRYLLRNLKHSWLSRETLCWFFFGFLVVLNWIMPHSFVRVLAVLSAMVLMTSQGFIVFRMDAIPAWNVFVMPILFISSGIMSGSGIAVLASGLTKLPMPFGISVIAMAAIGVNLLVWFIYLRNHINAGFPTAADRPRKPCGAIGIVGLGHVLPLILLFLFVSGKTADTGLSLGQMVTGLAMTYGVFVQKKAIIREISYMREIRIIPEVR